MRGNLCGFSYGATVATGGVDTTLAPAALAGLFATGNGVPPTGGTSTSVSDNGKFGAARDFFSFNAAGVAELVDGALHSRNLVTGFDAAGAGIACRRMSHRTTAIAGQPAIIVHGRS